MKIDKKSNYTLILQEETSLVKFAHNLEKEYDNFKENSIVIQTLDKLNITEKDFFVLLKHAKVHQENNKSFVVIHKNVNIDNFPETFNIVPTLTEAEDIVQMESIQRDLGF